MRDTISNAFSNAVGGLLDFIHKAEDIVSSNVLEKHEDIKEFFELWGVVSDIPQLLISYLWGPIGICIGCVVLVALVRTVLGWGNA